MRHQLVIESTATGGLRTVSNALMVLGIARGSSAILIGAVMTSAAGQVSIRFGAPVLPDEAESGGRGRPGH